MPGFTLRTAVVLQPTWAAWLASAGLTDEDVIITARPLRDAWMRNLPARVLCFEDFGHGEPTDVLMDALWAEVRSRACRRVIGIGGGSVLDTAKICALRPGATAHQIFAKQVAAVKDRELILIPTTCGTGSEVTCISIAAIPALGTKLGLAVPALAADQAVLIPELAAGLPEQVLITSAIDALVHAWESYLSPNSNPLTECFSVPAMQTILRAFRTFRRDGRMATVPNIISDLMLASCQAGIAFGNTGVGAVHALSYPISGRFHVPHGEANARFLLPVAAAYRAIEPGGRFARCGQIISEAFDAEASKDPWQDLQCLIDDLLPPKRLSAYGMVAADGPTCADTVISTQQRLLVNNWRPLPKPVIEAVYASIL